MPLNLTAVAPVKLCPVITTVPPAAAANGEKPVTTGVMPKVEVDCTVPLEVVTATLPVVAPVGTVAVINVAELVVNEDATPLNVTLLTLVKLVPLIVTLAPIGALVGVNDVMVGGLS